MIFSTVKSGWFYLVQGIVIFLTGLLILFNPETTLVTMTRILGIILLVAGGLLLFTASRMSDRTQNLMNFEGFVNLGLGLVFIIFPSLLAGAFIVILGVFTFISGLINLWMLIRVRARLVSAGFIRNSLLMLFGLFLLFNPVKAQGAIGVIIGSFALLFGAMAIYSAYRLFFKKKSGNIE